MSILVVNAPGTGDYWEHALGTAGRLAKVQNPEGPGAAELYAMATGTFSGVDAHGRPLAVFRLSNGVECRLSMQEYRSAVRPQARYIRRHGN